MIIRMNPLFYELAQVDFQLSSAFLYHLPLALADGQKDWHISWGIF